MTKLEQIEKEYYLNPISRDIITEMTYKIINEKSTLWEEKIQLCINQRPRWVPEFVWYRLLKLVLIQKVIRR